MSRQVSVEVLLSLLLPAVVAAETVDTAWVRRYDGPEHGQDWATCLQVDSQGNVYVAGPSAADTGYANLDYVVIKYRPNGDLAWLRRYDFSGGNDMPSGLGVDGQGNVYVTGVGAGRTATIRYDSIGRLVWLRTYGTQGGGSGLALDAERQLLLCGRVLNSTYDFVTMKYRPNGETAWVRTVDWAGELDAAVALDAGYDNGPVAVGECYDGSPGADYLTVAYDSAGTQRWLAVYRGPADWDIPCGIVKDSEGNVFVTGRSRGTSTGPDYLTIKYSPEGETLWTRRYNGPANDQDEARALAVDAEGNVYVTGIAEFTDTDDDYVTIKYAPGGAVKWLARYDGPVHSGDGAYALAVSESGDVYVTGSSWGGELLKADCATLRYKPQGETAWVRRYNSPANWAEYATELALGPDQEVCVAGRAYDLSGGNVDIIVIKYVQHGGAIEQCSTVPQVLPALTVEPSLCRDRAALTCRIRHTGRVRLTVRDAAGRRVRCLVDEVQTAGVHVVVWDLCDAAGRRVPAGVYVIELQARAARSRVKIEVLD